MSETQKTVYAEKAAAPSERDLALINRQSQRELTAEEVFLFRMAACDDQVDRDGERFTAAALEKLAELFVGKPVIMDHCWSAAGQTARVFDAAVEDHEGVKRLVLRCYMLRTEGTEETVAAIEGGIIRECSVGVSIGRSVCSICGAPAGECSHLRGRRYSDALCHFTLEDPQDAYEVSFVAVPAQRNAGIVKSKRYGGDGSPAPDGGSPDTGALALARARMELEAKRYGGNER